MKKFHAHLNFCDILQVQDSSQKLYSKHAQDIFMSLSHFCSSLIAGMCANFNTASTS